MPPTAHSLQREFTRYLDARFRLIPKEGRPAGIHPRTIPSIAVTRDADGREAIFTVTLSWGRTVQTQQWTTEELAALLLAESRKVIDAGLQTQIKGRSYVRRPLLTEQRSGMPLAGVLLRPKSKGKLTAYPLPLFPWHDEEEFFCIDSQCVEAAQVIFDEFVAICGGNI